MEEEKSLCYFYLADDILAYIFAGKGYLLFECWDNIEDEQTISHSSWEAAMYQVMIDSEWYWETYMPGVAEQVTTFQLILL